MGLLFTKFKHRQEEHTETSFTRYVESLLELYETITTNFTKGTKKRILRADNLHYIELIEELLYECIDVIEEDHGEPAVYFYKYQIAQINHTFQKNLLAMRGDNRLKIEDCIRNHERVRGWFTT
jgi:hypothetical protein